MVIKTFTSSSLEKCLQNASSELSIPIDKIKYEIKEKSGFLKKNVVIDVFIDMTDGKAGVENGKIYVVDPENEGKPAIIAFQNDMKIFVDGELIKQNKSIYKDSAIIIDIPKSEGKRVLNVKLSNDAMEAYAEISYEPAYEFSIEDEESSNLLKIRKKISNKVYPDKFNKEEVVEKLKSLGIVYGIQHEVIEENLKKEEDFVSFIVAKGLPKLDSKDDFIKLNFPNENKSYTEDDKGRIDYKNVGNIISIKAGEVIAEKIHGEEGKDGCDVTGNVLKHKEKNKITIKASKGCKITEDDKVIALIDGKPAFKNGIFQIDPIYEVNEDVTLKTGNVVYKGNLVVRGNIEEGMKIEGGSSVIVHKNVTAAKVIGGGEIDILGNVILSEIKGGGEDTEKTSYIELLEMLSTLLKEVVQVMSDIRRNDFVRDGSTDGQVIKALFESKFKRIPKICSEVLKHSVCDEDVNKIILRKLNALAPITIKKFTELEDYINIINNKAIIYRSMLNEPVNVKISYCQDSNINSTGDIYITGKGEYVSNIIAQGNIYFNSSESIARGGTIKAKNEIRCSIVGSKAGVSTRLVVEKNGHIYVKIAYPNTRFVVGVREYVLDVPSKDVHVYLDNIGDIVVDKLML